MPKIAIVNDEDKIIGSAEKSDARQKGQIHRIVRVLLYDGQGNILLQRRHPKALDSPDCWDFSAAGHVDEGENYELAAIRELEEELDVKNASLRPLFKFYTDRTRGAEQIRRFNMVFVAQSDPDAVHPNLGELGGSEWFNKAKIAQMIHDDPYHFSAGLKDHYTEILSKLDYNL